jgi:hypothetical protein
MGKWGNASKLLLRFFRHQVAKSVKIFSKPLTGHHGHLLVFECAVAATRIGDVKATADRLTNSCSQPLAGVEHGQHEQRHPDIVNQCGPPHKGIASVVYQNAILRATPIPCESSYVQSSCKGELDSSGGKTRPDYSV